MSNVAHSWKTLESVQTRLDSELILSPEAAEKARAEGKFRHSVSLSRVTPFRAGQEATPSSNLSHSQLPTPSGLDLTPPGPMISF